MKVKIFSSRDTQVLEDSVNMYLEKVSNTNFVDIKYSSSDEFSEVIVITRTEVE